MRETAVAWVRGALLGIAVLLTVGTGVDYVLRAMRLRATAPTVVPDSSEWRREETIGACSPWADVTTGSVRRRGSARVGTVIPPERSGRAK